MAQTILVTGAAGFIGRRLAWELLSQGRHVVGVDNLNDYYDPTLKLDRLRTLEHERFTFERLDIAEHEVFAALCARVQPEIIVHLAAQAGVRYSIDNPFAYARSNLLGHLSVLEAARASSTLKHLIYASSSSVYGERASGPFREDDDVDHPVSLYAATKRADELMSATYSHLYAIPQTGLRFFTVYGPWGRPDMAYWSFTEKILAGRPIEIFNQGRMQRDFTYVDDVCAAILAVIDGPPPADGHRVYNLGNNNPVGLMDFVSALEEALGRRAEKIMLPMQPGDVPATFADVSRLEADFGWRPTTRIEQGLPRFVAWYRDRYGV